MTGFLYLGDRGEAVDEVFIARLVRRENPFARPDESVPPSAKEGS
jgi:hypothetical protein